MCDVAEPYIPQIPFHKRLVQPFSEDCYLINSTFTISAGLRMTAEAEGTSSLVHVDRTGNAHAFVPLYHPSEQRGEQRLQAAPR